jgi:hypothetical protein
MLITFFVPKLTGKMLFLPLDLALQLHLLVSHGIQLLNQYVLKELPIL